MTADQKRAYVLTDNKLALNAGWDEELLALELQGLMEIDLDFNVGITGFSIAEIDGLMEGLSPEDVGDPDDEWTNSPIHSTVEAGHRVDVGQFML